MNTLINGNMKPFCCNICWQYLQWTWVYIAYFSNGFENVVFFASKSYSHIFRWDVVSHPWAMWVIQSLSLWKIPGTWDTSAAGDPVVTQWPWWPFQDICKSVPEMTVTSRRWIAYTTTFSKRPSIPQVWPWVELKIDVFEFWWLKHVQTMENTLLVCSIPVMNSGCKLNAFPGIGFGKSAGDPSMGALEDAFRLVRVCKAYI